MEPLSDRLEIWRGLLFGQRAMMIDLVSTLKREFDLTTAQYQCLLSLSENGGTLTAAQLASNLLYSSGSTTHLVAKLEEKGLIQRSRVAHDGRVVHIALTSEGEELIERATERHVGEIEEKFVPLITDAEAPHVLRFARRLADATGVLSQPPTIPERPAD